MLFEKIPLKGVFLPEKPLPMLIASFIIGVIVSICLDIVSNKYVFAEKGVLRFFSEFLAVVCAYFAEFICALDFNNGIIRWYHAVTLFLAVFLYRRFLSKYVVLTLDFIFSLIKNFLRLMAKYLLLILKIITAPVFAIYRKLIFVFCKKRADMRYKKYRKAYFTLASSGFYLVKN